MQTNNNIDKHIAEKLKNRELQPSFSAWERLSNQLDEHETKKKKRRWMFIGYAASILVLISAGIFYFTKSSEKLINDTNTITVDVPVDTTKFTIQPLKDLVPIEEAVVQTEKGANTAKEKEAEPSKQKNKTTPKVIIAKHTETTNQKKGKDVLPIKDKIITPVETAVIAKADVTQKETSGGSKDKSKLQKKSKKSKFRIQVNSDDLLYAVTHTPAEVKAYYAKYNVKRHDVLKTIQQELKKTNLKVDPNTILAEVEKNIDEDDFKDNFMQRLKTKISDIAVAIAYRNK